MRRVDRKRTRHRHRITINGLSPADRREIELFKTYLVASAKQREGRALAAPSLLYAVVYGTEAAAEDGAIRGGDA